MNKIKTARKNGVTADELARMVARGFEEMTNNTSKGFSDLKKSMNDRFEIVEGHLDAIDIELMDIRKKLDNIVYRHEFEFLKDRVSKLEERTGSKK